MNCFLKIKCRKNGNKKGMEIAKVLRRNMVVVEITQKLKRIKH